MPPRAEQQIGGSRPLCPSAHCSTRPKTQADQKKVGFVWAATRFKARPEAPRLHPRHFPRRAANRLLAEHPAGRPEGGLQVALWVASVWWKAMHSSKPSLLLREGMHLLRNRGHRRKQREDICETRTSTEAKGSLPRRNL